MEKSESQKLETDAIAQQLENMKKKGATEVMRQAARVAYKAERISGHIQALAFYSLDKESFDAQVSILFHKNILQSIEEQMDDICGIYDALYQKEVGRFAVEKLEEKERNANAVKATEAEIPQSVVKANEETVGLPRKPYTYKSVESRNRVIEGQKRRRERRLALQVASQQQKKPSIQKKVIGKSEKMRLSSMASKEGF